MEDIKLKFEKKGLGKIYKTINKLYKNETINENELNFYLNEIPKLKVGSKKFNSIKSDIKTFKKDADNKKRVKFHNHNWKFQLKMKVTLYKIILISYLLLFSIYSKS